jgi:hypothetical protein
MTENANRNIFEGKLSMKFTAWFCLIVGVFILTSWFFFLAAGQVPELATEPYAIAAHLVAEAATAVALIAAGVGLLRQRGWAPPVALVGLGMLIYTVINSSGYFAEQRDWPPVFIFALLLLLAAASIRPLLRFICQEAQ